MKLHVTPLALPEVLIIEPTVFRDHRGFLFESFNAAEFAQATGLLRDFVQDNHSRSHRGVLRGLHYQLGHPQGKLVRVVSGEVYDVAVDVRRGSSTFGRWVGATLSADNGRQIWIPEGFAHGFLVMSDGADVLYKATDYYHPESEHCIRWDDPDIGIVWPDPGVPLIMAMSRLGVPLAEAVLV
ncbi:dTDP-4-dehydrorhamnose 3,5-epimerase [Cupriavidus taiwanensis]|uniref:dTDP-4-dehydrorhamnose 3,5-epimerase n=1 Tax=Cupriavidus taiwanensis TaxID=164546 RepID=UPI000E144761|nr:dTDP-4-dehydrorhamnose 3,5-epimerase [Cupriavidus taiwanensis]SOY49477.1 dTDP-4-deoxyrhamnose-3,5-epimerase [Cupriavidus taiwanensis]